MLSAGSYVPMGSFALVESLGLHVAARTFEPPSTPSASVVGCCFSFGLPFEVERYGEGENQSRDTH